MDRLRRDQSGDRADRVPPDWRPAGADPRGKPLLCRIRRAGQRHRRGHGRIADDALARIEAEVNEHIWASLPVETREMKYKDAIAAGAMAFFADKYGDVVRVVDVPGVSLELCGGTHVGTTGQIALFRFTHETGAAAGVRRIEALTGPAAYRYALDLQSRLS